jgi:hypothetical protein
MPSSSIILSSESLEKCHKPRKFDPLVVSWDRNEHLSASTERHTMDAYLDSFLAILFNSETVLYTRYLADHGLLACSLDQANEEEFRKI